MVEIFVRINPGKCETNEPTKTKNKKSRCRRDKIRLIFHMSKFKPAVFKQVEQGCGFRLRTSVVDWQGRASRKRTRSPVTTSRSTSKTVKEPEGVKTKTTGGGESLPL